MVKKICFYSAAFWVLLVLALNGGLKDDLQISLEDKVIKDLRPTGLSLVFYVKISNTSKKTYELSGYSYRFVVNQKEYIRLNTSLGESIQIDARQHTLIAIPVKITYEHLFRTVSEVENKDKAVCYLMGELAFSEKGREKGRLSFAFSGEFPIFKKPDVKIVALKVNDLTIGGADINLHVKFSNQNGFELLVDRIDYEIKIGGHEIGKGWIGGDKSIEAYGEKNFSLPMLLNFFEVGKEIYAFLQQTSALCEFSGEVSIQTVWGMITVHYKEQEKVAIIKTS
ncbi:MAG: LEA type 2 family protein [Candidatus Aminicenantes bacterium]|nr:LEA type 2 family protein [Candidatus Aminicenantes bacterium]